MVGVLVLVDEHVAEPAPVVLADVGERLEQVDRGHDQVVEVERVGLAQPPLVGRVRRGAGLLEVVARLAGRLLGVAQLVLVVGHPVEQRVGRVALRVELEVLGNQRHQPLGVGGVVDRERRLEAELVDLLAQDPHAGGVEGAHPHDPGPPADEVLDPLLHLGGGLVGEGDRQDRARVGPPLGDQPGDPAGQHPGLARPGAGHHQQRAPAWTTAARCGSLRPSSSSSAGRARGGSAGSRAASRPGIGMGVLMSVPAYGPGPTPSPARQGSSSATTESTTATRSPPVSLEHPALPLVGRPGRRDLGDQPQLVGAVELARPAARAARGGRRGRR